MTEKTRRILMTLGGVSVCGISVGMFNFSNFGMDPFQVLAHGISYHVPMGFGTLYAIINLVMLGGVFLFDRSKIGLGTFINIFLLGYVVEFSSWIFKAYVPSTELWVRAAFLVAGILILCIGAALYFVGDLGVSTYDAIALTLSERTPIKFQYLRMSTDIVCTLTGFLFGAVVGIGTLVTALFMGPLIAYFRRHLAMPMRYGRARAAELHAAETRIRGVAAN
jgi:uncharacterized membrane protein YczE